MNQKKNQPISRLEAYCHGPAYLNSRKALLNHIKVDEDQIKSAKHTLDILLSRHDYLSKIEAFIADSPVLLQYYSQAEDEVTRAGNFSMATIFITALEKISEVLLEHEKGYDSMTTSELLVTINQLENENRELKSTLDQIAKIFGVIEK